MNFITSVFILLFGTYYVCDAGYGKRQELADFEISGYAAPYSRHHKSYSDSKTGYGRTKYGYYDTETGPSKPNTGYSHYGGYRPNAPVLADVEAPAYAPPYSRYPQYRKTYSGTKTGYGGTKTGGGGTKTGGGGTKTGRGGTKTGHGGTKTGYSGYGGYRPIAPVNTQEAAYRHFQGSANAPYKPLCKIECKNNGICTDVDTCQCMPNFEGKYCEFEKKPCLTYPPLPNNSNRNCSNDYCTVKCMEGHRFYDGSNVANLKCIDGQWQPTRADLTSLSDCVPECKPPCLNGGVCLSVNTCQCSADYRGPQCQYAASECDIRKLAFNGGYKCFGDADKFSCTLSCPSGASFSVPKADQYTCLYSKGIFEPQPIPHCVYDEVVVITPSNHHNNPYAPRSNNTFIPYEQTTEGSGKYGHHVKRPIIVVQDLTPKPGSCLTWAGLHYKTFDGKIYSYQTSCNEILVRDSVEHKYTVAVKHSQCKRQGYCPYQITIYLEEKMYVLSTDEDGTLVFSNSKRRIPIPATLPGIRVSMPSDQVLVNLDLGITLKWDTNDVVLVEGSVLAWNKTEGLCGTLDGNPENDMITKEGVVAGTKSYLFDSWKLHDFEDMCASDHTENSACNSKTDEDMKRAIQFCNSVFTKDKFRKCSKVMDVSQLLEACQWDYCACATSLSPEECACRTVSVYAKECLRHGLEEMRSWRDSQTCPMKCPEGKIYKACGPDSQPSCAFPEVVTKGNSSCVEGCFCPEGLLLESGRCVQKSECPCRIRNKAYPPGAIVPKKCNTCKCEAGEWLCTQVPCGARCGTVGDPHYTTFDGLRYNFMGRCTYTLMKTENITIDAENVACSGAITEAMNLSPYKGEGKPSCTKAVNLQYFGTSIHLKQGGFILVNEKEVTTLPAKIGDIRIRAASSLFIIIQMPGKVSLWWDGNTRVFVDVPPSLRDKTQGLCGTFNLNQKDDFLTPEGDIEQSVTAFANKWKTREFCDDVSVKEPEHPCKANVENKDAAEKYCSQLKSSVFESCHWHVDVQPYYEDCLYDMCACADDVSRCLCPILGDYADACARSGVMVQWRYDVKECELQCTGGQEYTVCADSCLRTCSDVALSADECKPSCVEGCACPVGQVLDNNNICVPIAKCPCYHKGMEFKSGYKEVRAGKRERELCTCVGARWECQPATFDQIQNYPPAEDLRSNCSAARNMEFTTCETAEPLTCKNMHLPATVLRQECRPGCQCKKGFVMDVSSKACVVPTACPCHHGGRSYPDGHTMQEACNTCECKSGKWECTDRQCEGVCSAWGDSHVTTFDGQNYDFEGVCTYLLAKGTMEGKDGFSVEIQNEPCGTTGATCSKSVTLRVGSGGADEETVSLTKSAPLPEISDLKRIKLRQAGAYVFLDVKSLGMSLQWDRSLRVYIKVDSMWQNRVKGLCGNFNSDMRDDFQTPSGGGIAETSALIFADSWKLKPTCPKAQEVTNHCIERPNRKEWASTTCGTMKRYPFTLCHAEVSPDDFVSRCEADACACDSGADCDCACAALAAYAYACVARGVSFKWRTQELCPMQCDEVCSNYNECITPCPPETCDNTIDYVEIKAACEKETCVEGCKRNKTCPEGTVYFNSSLTDCVPRSKCKPVCMTLEDGKEILEGEIIEEDACHTCRCSKKEKICTGQPCATEPVSEWTTVTTLLPVTTPHDRPLTCKTGWTEWISRGDAEIGPTGASVENEPLPQLNELTIGSPMCNKDMMTKIECRTVNDHKTPKETGLNVECSLEKGLVCLENEKTCPDFEIRVYCKCEEEKTTVVPTTTEPFQCLDAVHPNHKHPTNCGQFYECTPDMLNLNKIHTVLKNCSEGLMYNPDTMVCDWPDSVIAVRPECGKVSTTSTTELPEEEEEERGMIPPFIRKDKTTHVPSPTETTTPQCPPGQVYKSCAFPCDKLCDHFKQSLQKNSKCFIGQECVDGCVDEDVANIKCEFGSMWRDHKTCVPIKDCTCDNEGEIVKPGGVVVRNVCEKCQCLDNALHCDSSECVVTELPTKGPTHEPVVEPEITTTASPSTTHFAPPPNVTSTTSTTLKTPTTRTTPTTLTPLIIKTTATPPPECNPAMYINLLWEGVPLPKESFTASSSAGPLFEPQYAILNGRSTGYSAGSWNPSESDPNPYIQVELPSKEPIYGIIMQGSPMFDQYVESYELMYGDDGNVFSTVDGPDGTPKIFRGPVAKDQTMKQMIEPPIEAKFVRIKPLTWHDDISVRLELIGCQEVATTPSVATPTTTPSTTTASTTTPSTTTPSATTPSTTSTSTVTPTAGTTIAPPSIETMQCTEALGIASELPISMIEVSSNFDARPFLKLDSERGWRPAYSTPGEWIMFNFTSPRNITGIKTKGGAKGHVTAYNVMYTSDLRTFNPVLDSDGNMQLFPANFDKDSVILNEFKKPIRAQYLKILPVKWEKNIEIRVEPIGCYEPYPETRDDETVPMPCQMCPGTMPAVCSCTGDQYYDGESCVPRDQCPCVIGFITYPVGAKYSGENCDECVCKIGGVPSCKPAKQCDCEPHLVPTLTPSCECLCEPCTNGTKICPTSKICLPLEKWCNGLVDCPDDELECTTIPPVIETVITTVVPTVAATKPSTATTTPVTTVAPTTTTETPLECPKVECPPGYFVRETTATHSSYSRSSTLDLPPPRPRNSYQRFFKGGFSKGGRGGFSKGGYSKGGFSKGGFSKGGMYGPPSRLRQSEAFTLDKPALNANVTETKKVCPQFKCIPKLPPLPPKGSTAPPRVCSTPTCPPQYTLKLESVPESLNLCPQYICVPPPERFDYCNVTGRTFTTFDGTEYPYDICFHTLARENRFNAWSVFIRKKCLKDTCQNQLIILQDDQLIVVKPNLMIDYNDYEYTVEQTCKICFQKNSFDVNRLGNGVFIKSRRYNFTVFYSPDGDVKIGVTKKYMGHVDGLCGAYDGVAYNDRSLPNGRLANSLEQFGRSWAKPGLPANACEIKVIPPHEQKRCWDVCKPITEEPLAQCGRVLNLDTWRKICLEKVCKCAEEVVNGTKRTEEECRCLLLEKLVAECLAADKNMDIASWRIQMNCPAECPPPLVHYDCYRRRCEPTCTAITTSTSSNGCPVEDGQCFPGCYCPEGTLRKGDQCVTPNECLDCACTGVGTPAKYVTFEGDDLPFLGNCTYLASRDANETGYHRYQVYVTNGPCADNPSMVCVKAVHLMQEKNFINITKDATTKKLITTVNGAALFKYPFTKDWVSVSILNGQDVSVQLPDLHVELIVFEAKMEFTVQLPSQIYANRTQGLCGVCAGYQELLITSNGTATDDFDVYGKSWQASPEALKALEISPQEQCDEPPPPPVCVPPPVDSNPCYNINDVAKFGQCHALVEPEPFIEKCEEELCESNSTDACPILERYAAECRKQGVCVDWRRDICPYPCEAPLVYRTCVDCERTCENNDELEENPIKCDKRPVDGCFCPEGKVRVNNTCIEPNKCFPCDAKKEHYAGDEWKEDACTKCTCSKLPGENAAHVSCTTQTCTVPVCSDLENRVTVPAKLGACCPEYVCVPKSPDERCEEPKKLDCGFGQVLKTKTRPDGCKEFACECKPPSECEPIPDESEVEMFKPGVKRVIDNSGCCPKVELVCVTCPKPPACPHFQTLKTTNVSGECCPEHKCELPKDKCVINLEWQASPKGGEKPLSEPQTALKELDESWWDGPCRSCRCELSAGVASPACRMTECPPILSTDQYVVEPRPLPYQCCPAPVHVACRDGDNIYKVGENWTSPYDVCESYECSQLEDGKLEKVTTVQKCDTDCQPGWEYFPATEESKQCCGRCKPVACVVDGTTHKIGKTWTSPDFCTNYTCKDLNGTLQVQSVDESCPEISDALKKQFVLSKVKVPGECCLKEEPIACRVGDQIYQVGENWTSTEDACESYECSQLEDGKLEKVTTVQKCDTDCQPGWEYFPSTEESKQCCGRCKPVACVVDGTTHKIGKTWTSPDFCTNYTCKDLNGTLQVQSVNESCPKISDALKKQFVLSKDKIPGECCLKEEPIACRVGNKIYQEDQTWPSSDPCKNYTCSRDVSGRLTHEASVENCAKECERGEKYVEPEPGVCCGKCLPDKCIVEDELKDIGDTWQSADNCTSYSCDGVIGQVLVTSSRELCPDVSACEPENLVNQSCCQVCKEKPSDLRTCAPKEIPAVDTVGLIQISMGYHGRCTNQDQVKGFTECIGTCESGTFYNKRNAQHESSCECCQAVHFVSLDVMLTCEDGTRQPHRAAAPTICDCRKCGEETWTPGGKGFKRPGRREGKKTAPEVPHVPY